MGQTAAVVHGTLLALKATEGNTSVNQRRKAVNIRQPCRRLILREFLGKPLGILRIMWKKSECE